MMEQKAHRVLEIARSTIISRDQLAFSFSRSSGPGGQNVNKLNTRVTVILDIPNCPDLTQPQKDRIITRLRTRTSKQGILRVTCGRHRTQAANRDSAVDTLLTLLRDALKPRPVRRKTTVPRYATERRLAQKGRNSELKRQRSARNPPAE